MNTLAAQPAFVAYAITLIVLSANMLALWVYSGAVRSKTKTTHNQEDAALFGRGIQVAEAEPPEVARVLRAHDNATANIVPFALLGLVFVLAGGPALPAEVIFAVFTFGRIVHSLAYVGAKQPLRTISFAVGTATTLVLMGFIVRQLVAA